jgi:Tfp pilus assembly protein PilX
MNRLRNEQGSALMMAVIMLFVVLGLGTALIMTANAQHTDAANQQSGENSYSMAEAALNAQIYALSVTWPTANNGPGTSSTNNYGYPSSCNTSNAGTSYCPSSSDLAAYPSNTQSCPTGTPGDAWTPSPTRSAWTTYVRDGGAAGSSQQNLFNDATEKAAVPYNSSFTTAGTNYVWVRAVGTVNCKTSVVVAEVSMQTLSLIFPKDVLNANGFTTTNNGNKTILNTADQSGGASSQISVRCGGTSYTPPPPSTCVSYGSTSQISPTDPTSPSTWLNPPASSPVLNSTQMADAKAMAQAAGTYIPASTSCSSISASQLAGALVYIEGSSSCDISITSNPVINSASSPGTLILANGTLDLGGSATFYGLVYAANQSGLTSSVVNLNGTATVVGGIAADGNASLSLGSSGNGVDCDPSNKCGDLMFDSAAFNNIVGFGGADQTPNTFRQLPVSQ